MSHKESFVTAARRLSLVVLAATLAACGSTPPQAWEKGLLAKPEMTMGTDLLEQRLDQRVYSSKENASGGYGVGGGGCGCN
jgi:hypothetical protein